MSVIERLSALEILDSRGRPTVLATCRLAGGAAASASVPSGASTGGAEAVELRDGDPARYAGLGCRNAVEHVRREIARHVQGRAWNDQAALDRALIDLDGTPNKARLGANAILAVSLAFARAQAVESGTPLYRHFAAMLGEPIRRLPRMTINLFSGGKHAGGQIPIQDVLIIPARAASIADGLVAASAVYRAAVRLVERKYGMRWLTADEGGLAPPAETPEQLFDDALAAIREAGLEPGRDVCLAVDVASSHFYRDGRYHLGPRPLDSSEMIRRLADWVGNYPIVSIEDGLAEEDWDHWPALSEALGSQALTLGDDLLCTHPQRIARAVQSHACRALLLKVNQIGTLSEALQAHRLARAAGWQVVISVRSGDTEDNWYSDLVVGWSGDQTKAGSLTQSERLSKYNRLLAIEAELPLPVRPWPGPAADGDESTAS
jgi:enolase